MEDSSFCNMPSEVMCTIFSRMDFSTILQARQVCFQWQRLLDKFFIKANISLTNANFPYIRKCKLETVTLTVKDFCIDCSSEPKTLSRNRLARNAKHLIFCPPSSCVNSEHRRIVQENIRLILTLNPGVESIIFEENSLKSVDSLKIRGNSFRNLTCLSIDFSYATDRQVFHDFIHTRFPALRSVQLSEYWSEFGPETGHGYVGMYQFLGNHKSSLRFVTMVHPMRNSDVSYSNNRLMSPRKTENLLKSLGDIKLSSLYLYFVSVEGSGNFTLAGHLLKSQNSLSKLQVAIGGNYFYALPQVKDAIRRNASTLEYVSILSHEQWGVFVNLSDTLEPLSQCSKLECFEIDHFFVPSLPLLPSTVRILSVSGYLMSDQVLAQITSNLTNLEQLSYTDMSSHPYGSPEDLDHFKRIIGLPKMKRIRICKQHLPPVFQDFLDQQENISWSEVTVEVTFRDNFLPFYELTMLNRANGRHRTSVTL